MGRLNYDKIRRNDGYSIVLCRNLVETEKQYVEHLYKITHLYRQSLDIARFSPHEELDSLFSVFDDFFELHVAMYRRMCSLQTANQNPAVVLADHNDTYGTIYTRYTACRGPAADILANELSASRLLQFLQPVVDAFEKNPADVANLPENRVAFYKLLLREQLHCAEPTTTETPVLQSALKFFRSISEISTDAIIDTYRERLKKARKLFPELCSLEVEHETFNRHLVLSQTLIKFSKGNPQNRVFYLTDACLFYSDDGGWISRPTIRDLVPLKYVSIYDCSSNEELSGITLQHAWILYRSDKEKKYIIVNANERDKIRWMNAIHEMTERLEEQQ